MNFASATDAAGIAQTDSAVHYTPPGQLQLRKKLPQAAQESLQEFHRHAHDVGEAAFNAFDKGVAHFLDRVRAGLSLPGAARNVLGDLRLRESARVHRGDIGSDDLDSIAEADQGQTRDDQMGSAEELPRDSFGVVGILRFADHLAIEVAQRVGADDQGVREVRRDASGLGQCQLLCVSAYGLGCAGEPGFIESGRDSDKGVTGLREELPAPRGGRGQDNLHEIKSKTAIWIPGFGRFGHHAFILWTSDLSIDLSILQRQDERSGCVALPLLRGNPRQRQPLPARPTTCDIRREPVVRRLPQTAQLYLY